MSIETSYPFQNTSLPLEERVADLVSRFTLEEKVDLMIQYQTEVQRLGVKPYKHGTEAAHGMAWLGEATGYPQPIGLSSIWDEELLQQIGSAIGDEARGFYKRNPAINGLTLWAPTVDMERDPRWGRTEEAYGEDPILAGKLSAALVRGIQGDHPKYLKAVATLKHFIANNNEVGRGDASVSIDPRNMREYYLKAFEIPFKEGGAQSMMTSYNAVNGVPANLNPDVNGIVKGEWGMDGFVVSDAFDVSGTVRDHGYLESHTEAVARSVKEGGIDSLTDDGELMKSSLREALKDGQITEDDLDVALRNTFRVRFRLGEFDPEEGNPYAAIDESVIMKKEHAELARTAARKSIVLLKNDNQTLPLKVDQLSKVAVIGPLGDIVYRDWYSGELPYAITPRAGIQEKLNAAGKGGQTTFAGGTDRIKLKSKKNGQYVKVQAGEEALLTASVDSADQASVFELTDWGWDNTTMIAEENGLYVTTDDRIVKASANRIWEWFTKEVFLARQENGNEETLTFSTWKDTPVTVGEQGELLSGDGRGEETSNEIDAGGTSALDNSAAAKLTADSFTVEKVTDKFAAARQAAQEAEVAVVFVGNHPLINGKETVDRPDITLPQSQEQLIQEVLAVNPNTIVVVIGSYPYALNWVNAHVPAVLYSTHAGQEVGRAIADVLFGEENPAGRLSMTWYQSVDQLPEFMDYDIIQGNRTYRYFEGEALYPFGHGLSYTTFRYEALKLDTPSVNASEEASIQLTVTVTNTGDRAGDEVVQVYGRVEESRVKRPMKQLLAFRRVQLAAGETKEVSFSIKLAELAVWDVTQERFVIEQAKYTLLAGPSSGELPLKASLDVSGEVIPARDLTQPTKAINYDAYEGVILGECREGGSAVEVVGESGWIAFKDVEFATGAKTAVLRVASARGGTIEVRLGHAAGQLIGTASADAGGIQQWSDVEIELSGVSGRQDLYVLLQGKLAVSKLQLIG
ncbi:beta-glucosidase [Saccharibacillus sp. O16]|nr:beta-glucosidase [Saccharibacillus sp. O16]